MKFTDVCANEPGKRAAEVALAGGHSIWFVGSHQSEAEPLAEATHEAAYEIERPVERQGNVLKWGDIVDVHALSPCPCGYYGDQTHECTCDPQQITDYRLWTWPPGQPDIYIEVFQPDPEKIIEWASFGFYQGEYHDRVIARILRSFLHDTPEEVEEGVWHLLKQLCKTHDLTPRQTKSALTVAKTIARLAGADTVEPSHAAEAFQYRMRR